MAEGGQREVLTAKAMLELARRKMDEFGREIFDTWFNGRAPSHVTLDSEKWGGYMRANEDIGRQILDCLKANAEIIRPRVDAASGRLAEPFSYRFHGEVGGKHGGYGTGYQLLHGSNRAAGDCEVKGRLTAVRKGPPGSGYDLHFADVEVVFNDIVDINKTYSMDIQSGNAARNIAKTLGVGPPKDFTLHVKWRAGDLDVTVPADLKDQPPIWLKTWTNK